MIGQEKLLSKLNKINTLDDISKSIIVVGESGSGRHLFINELFDRFTIDIVNIDFELSLDILNDMYALSIPKVYVVDLDKLGEHKRIERFQNTILKFLEEPPKFAWIIILCSNIDNVLYTIKNRCQIYKIQPYSLRDLRQIADTYNKNYTDNVLKLLRTPGNIIYKDISQINELITLSKTIIESIGNATPANALSIRDKFFREENPLDLDMFIDILYNEIFTYYREKDYSEKYFKMYLLTSQLKKDLRVLGVNKKYLIDNYLLELKDIYARFS